MANKISHICKAASCSRSEIRIKSPWNIVISDLSNHQQLYPSIKCFDELRLKRNEQSRRQPYCCTCAKQNAMNCFVVARKWFHQRTPVCSHSDANSKDYAHLVFDYKFHSLRQKNHRLKVERRIRVSMRNKALQLKWSNTIMKFILNIFDEQKKERIREEKKKEAQNDRYYWSTK